MYQDPFFILSCQEGYQACKLGCMAHSLHLTEPILLCYYWQITGGISGHDNAENTLQIRLATLNMCIVL